MQKTEKQRTYQTEKALRRLFKQISDHCISVGLDQKTVTEKLDKYPIQTSPQFVNEVWRVIMVGTTGKTTKAELLQSEVDMVYDEFNKFWSEVTGEHFAFPSYDQLAMQALIDNSN